MTPSQHSDTTPDGDWFTIRQVTHADLPDVVNLDARVTGMQKQDYWDDIYVRFVERGNDKRFFLVAQANDAADNPALLGFVVGEVRAWEFGSAPCGWITGISVDPDSRLHAVGECLFRSISEKFEAIGITTMRTMVGRSNHLLMAFFRSEGMMAGPYLQLEKELG